MSKKKGSIKTRLNILEKQNESLIESVKKLARNTKALAFQADIEGKYDISITTKYQSFMFKPSSVLRIDILEKRGNMPILKAIECNYPSHYPTGYFEIKGTLEINNDTFLQVEVESMTNDNVFEMEINIINGKIQIDPRTIKAID